MAVPPSSPANGATSQRKNNTKPIDRPDTPNEEPPNKTKPSKCPGVRVIGGRIYDSENGRYCHQCHQKTMDFTACCKNMKLDKQCTINFCHKCLLNRYGEKAEDMAVLDDWMCPRCRGICNCSFCMKKRGHMPTGVMVHAAKATGFSSVSHLLDIKGPDVFQEMTVKNKLASPKKVIASTEEPVVVSPKKLGKENSVNGTCNAKVNSSIPSSSPDKKMNKNVKREGQQEKVDSVKDNVISNKKMNKKVKREGQQEKVDSVKDNGISNKKMNKKVKREGQPEKVDSVKDNGILNKKMNKKVKREGQQEKVDSVKDNGISNKKMNKKVKREGQQEKVDSVKDNGISNSPRKVADDSIRKSPRKQGIPQEVIKIEENMKANDCNIPAVDVKEELKKEKKPKVQMNAKLKPRKINVVTLSSGTLLSNVVGINLLPEDIGHALQFLEFCSTFEKVLDIRKGQAESVLRAIICGRSTPKGKSSSGSPAIHFLTQLLSFILKSSEEESPPSSPTNDNDSWIHSLKRCLSESECELDDIPENCFDKGCLGYEMLEPSQKLKLLTFLCDEALYTEELRNWIEEQNVQFVEKMKESKEDLNVAQEKKRLIKRKLQVEIAKVIMEKHGVPLTMAEHTSIASNIKAEAEQARAEMLDAMDLVPKKKQRADAVRTAIVSMDEKGHAYWKLNCFKESDLLRQDVGDPEEITSKDKWFTFSTDEATVIKRHISSQRLKRKKAPKSNVDLSMYKINSCDIH